MSDETLTVARRWAITGSIMLAALMNTIDTTIANVVLPHIQGSVEASQEEITWVLTSYIIATAVMTPTTAWWAQRIGRKELFIVSIIGFTAASALCGMATTLPELVIFRGIQGVCAASLLPLAQSVLLDLYPRERYGEAMAIFGAGVILGPVIGPVLGGWLTDNWSWRWVFFINLPVGVLATLGVTTFMKEKRGARPPAFDFAGFATLAIALCCVQLALDRGPTEDWLSSKEIWVYVILGGLGLYWFIIQTLTAKRPFFDPRLLADRNFVTATFLGFFVGMILYSAMALLPQLMENDLGYSVVQTGLVLCTRGLGMMLSMVIVGRAVSRFDPRWILGLGFLLNAIASWEMTHFDLLMDSHLLVASGLIQGLGIGMIFVPLSTVAFTTLLSDLRTEATAVYTLVRNVGSAVGISLMQAIHVHNSKAAHSRMVENLIPGNQNVEAYLHAPMNLTTKTGLAAVNAMVHHQAEMFSFVFDFHIMLVVTVAIMPLILLIRTRQTGRRQPQGAVADAAE
jgi:DHA2 family multidrug resistance protein